MKLVTREEIIDYATYDEQRNQIRPKIMELKDSLRVHLGDYLTFLFETKETVRYQIQEMMRIERIVKEAEIKHEIDTYNELLGGPGEIGCTLLIEIDDPAVRDVKLKELLGLPEKLYVKLESGDTVFANFNVAQVGDDRLSSVQYLTFKTEGNPVTAVGAEHPQLTVENDLTAAQKEAMAGIEAD